MTKHTQKTATSRIKTKSVSYQDYLIDSLKDPIEAAGYLNAALEAGDGNVFRLALQNVIQAHGSIVALAAKAKRVELVYINHYLKMAIALPWHFYA